MKKIITLQEPAVRLIDNSKTKTHSDPIFLEYNIIKIKNMLDFNQAMFMFKYTKACYQIHLKISIKLIYKISVPCNHSLLTHYLSFGITFLLNWNGAHLYPCLKINLWNICSTNTFSSAIDLSVSLVNDDINLLIHLYMLSSYDNIQGVPKNMRNGRILEDF